MSAASRAASNASVVIDRTDIRVSRIALGTGSLHHVFSRSARQRLLAVAHDAGITHFDTAPYYGEGLAEHDLGAMPESLRRATTVTTKIGLYARQGAVRSAARLWARRILSRVARRDTSPVADLSLARSRESLESSLRRMRRERIDFLLLHEPTLSAVPHEALRAWLDEERATGRVGAFGVAGERERLEPFLVAGSALADVVQTRDSCERREASFLDAFARPLQFTYGYFSRGGADFGAALGRNATGAVIFSTRRIERMQEVARWLR